MIPSYSDKFEEILVASYKKAPISQCKVISHSMFPLLRKGDWIIVNSNFHDNEIKPGVILLYHVQNKFIVHRIVRIDADRITTKGDFSLYLDPPIKNEQIIGIVVAVKKGKHTIQLNHPLLILNQFMIMFNHILLVLKQ